MAREIYQQQEMMEEMIGELERARRENERLILKLERAKRREKEAIAQMRFVNAKNETLATSSLIWPDWHAINLLTKY